MQLPIINIGIKTREQIADDKNSASDRIRAKLIADEIEGMEIYDENINYHNVIFHYHDDKGLKRLRELAVYGGIAIFDICDYNWENNEAVLQFAKKVDHITVASEPLKDKLKEDGVDTPITVIGDGHNVEDRRKKWHKDKVKKIVWFGYSDNQHILDDYYEFLEEHNIKLRIIAEHNINRKLEFVEWDVDTYYDLINECDIALLPKNGIYKTNNKDVTAWLCGLPVAKTKEELLKLLSKEERLKYLYKIDYREFNIYNNAKKYFDICVGYYASERKQMQKMRGLN